MKILIVLALTCAAAYAQVPVKCAAPDLMTAMLFEFDGTKNWDRFAQISYDAINQRVRIVEVIDYNQTREFYDELFIHQTKEGYILNLKTRKCEKFTLTHPFRKIEIPEFAQFMGEAYIGASAPQEGVLVTIWSGNTPGGGQWFGSYTQPGCVPVLDGYASNASGYIQWNFFDVINGIPDPNVFIPPPECM